MFLVDVGQSGTKSNAYQALTGLPGPCTIGDNEVFTCDLPGNHVTVIMNNSWRRVGLGLFLLVLFSAIVLVTNLALDEKRAIIHGYQELVRSDSTRLLEHCPRVLDESDCNSVCVEEVDVGEYTLSYPWPVEKVSIADSGVLAVYGPEGRLTGLPPEDYGFEAFARKMAGYTASFREKMVGPGHVGDFEDLLLPDLGIKTEWPVILTEQWHAVMAESQWAPYWKQYAEDPYGWFKRALYASPRPVDELHAMDVDALEVYYSLLYRKALFLRAVEPFGAGIVSWSPPGAVYLFEGEQTNAIIEFGGKAVSLLCWSKPPRTVFLSFTLECHNKRPSVEFLGALIGSIEYSSCEACARKVTTKGADPFVSVPVPKAKPGKW